jgi:putative transcriptional regulator|uniref:helix-turn-helix transcriptional regulator n=1 Tax=Rheinheimera sp. TaxID=1869214 RepID=UPI00404787A2
MNNIAYWREKAGLTQSELAALCGWEGEKPYQGRISNYEKGLRQPSIKHCQAIVKALQSRGLKCSLDDVFPPATAA